MSVSGPAAITVQPGYASARDGALTRIRMRFSADHSGRAAVTVCAV